MAADLPQEVARPPPPFLLWERKSHINATIYKNKADWGVAFIRGGWNEARDLLFIIVYIFTWMGFAFPILNEICCYAFQQPPHVHRWRTVKRWWPQEELNNCVAPTGTQPATAESRRQRKRFLSFRNGRQWPIPNHHTDYRHYSPIAFNRNVSRDYRCVLGAKLKHHHPIISPERAPPTNWRKIWEQTGRDDVLKGLLNSNYLFPIHLYWIYLSFSPPCAI